VELAFASVVAALGGPGEEPEERTALLAGLMAQTTGVGPLEVTLEPRGDCFAWAVANRGDGPVPVRSVGLVLRVVDVVEPLRMFRHGYQSWSRSGVATLGVDADPSERANLPFVQGVYHADSRRVRNGELRSEWCTVLADATGGASGGRGSGRGQVVLGFDGGHEHDGTFRLRRGADGGAELVIEAFLGGAVLAPGESRVLHGVTMTAGDAPASALLAAWAAEVGRAGGARVGTTFSVGWCSWYHFFDRVTEADLRRNLAAADAWPFDVFQLDDGYQAAIGDWYATNAKFPSDLETLAADIAGRGLRPGLWLAPFLAAPDSDVVCAHPEWVARAGPNGPSGWGGPEGDPLRSWWNPAWGGGEDGFMYSLDTTHPEVLHHLEELGRDLVDAGFRYLKLDFTFAPAVDGRWHDPGQTPAQRVRAGYQAIRRGAGDETVVLGCGVPLANVVGVVDVNRIGADVAPLWALAPSEEIVAGYLDVQPATRSAFAATLARSFMHRQLWVNDPDCMMLRTEDTALGADTAETWDRSVGLSGGLVMVSDDLGLLGPEARRRLEEVVNLGTASDEEARSGRPALCPDLMDRAVATTLATARHELVADPDAGTSVLRSR
jgi:alpha-galactosidase